MIESIDVKWYDKAEDILLAYWKGGDNPPLSLTELLDDDRRVVATDETGATVDATAVEMLEGIKQQGVWGFSCERTKTVHAWARTDADPLVTIEMLGEMIGGLTPKGSVGPGLIAAKAYRLLMLQPVKGTVQ